MCPVQSYAEPNRKAECKPRVEDIHSQYLAETVTGAELTLHTEKQRLL